jgi:hypothetical protein
VSYTLEGYYLARHGDTPLILGQPAEVDAVLDAMQAAGDWNHSALELTCRELPLSASGLPNHNMLVGVDHQEPVGAIYYFGEDVDDVYFTRSTHAAADDEVIYGYMGNERFFPRDSEVPIDLIRRAVKEFLATARRPTCVSWQPWSDVPVGLTL